MTQNLKTVAGLCLAAALAPMGGCASDAPSDAEADLLSEDTDTASLKACTPPKGRKLPWWMKIVCSTQRKPDAGAGAGDAAAAGGHDPGHGGADGGTCETFSGSFDAIQKVIFERRGCTASACHGEAKVGGLDLRADVAYENLVDAPSKNSENARVQPGTATESYLYQKLQAATHPGSLKITGSPMPVGTPPLTPEELEAVALWIQKGAPKSGSVSDPSKGIDVGSLLDACLPPARPVKTKPLEPPAPDEGVQFVLPNYLLKAHSEVENCTPFVYDFTHLVPPQYKDEKRNVMFVNGSRVRQDPQSHHLVLMDPRRDLSAITSETGWVCRSGDRDGMACNPKLGSADCGAGVCAGSAMAGSVCGFEGTGFEEIGIDPANFDPTKLTPEQIAKLRELVAKQGSLLPAQIANTQSPQEYIPPLEGVYWEIPLRGVLYFNSHAFNLLEEDTVLDARVNFYFAKSRGREMRPVNVTDQNYVAAGQPPFTRKTYCSKYVVPEKYSMALLTGHTHRRGEHFWVTDAAGKRIYENFVYNDPVYMRYDPWLTFDTPDPAARTLEYCATYSNGLTKDDKPDTDLVTRASRMPERTRCTPVACVAGKVAASCTTDRDCDSAPGANDGDCDACPITAGTTTENEMFVLMPWFVLPPKP